MRIGVKGPANCKIDAPGYGSTEVKVEALGHGFSQEITQDQSRIAKSFYPNRVTSGAWFIEAVFPSVEERDAFNVWVMFHAMRTTDPYSEPLSPFTVSVPSEEFARSGYVTSTLEFGDAQGRGKYRSVIQFTTASRPDTTGEGASRYISRGGLGLGLSLRGNGVALPDPIQRRPWDPVWGTR